MKKLYTKLTLFFYKDFQINYTRIKNDIYGNPRFEVQIFTPEDIEYAIKYNSYIIPMWNYKITSYNIEEEIKSFIDNEIKNRKDK